MKYIILLFLLAACMNNSIEKENYRLLQEWVYAKNIKLGVPTGIVVERPPGAEVLLLQLDLEKKSHCVYYLVPFKTKSGKITVVENKNITSCPETNQGEGIVEIKNVNNLKIDFNNFNLKLAFVHVGAKELMEFPLYNINFGNVHQKFKSMKTKSLLSGLKLYSGPPNYIGKSTDRFSKGQALRCHQVNPKCETVGEFRCDDCRYGWYEVADYNCPQGGSKFCGQNHCGEKNEPACPRGYKLFEFEDTGICQEDLVPVYNSDHILVCQ
jgi:hypothetical protein